MRTLLSIRWRYLSEELNGLTLSGTFDRMPIYVCTTYNPITIIGAFVIAPFFNLRAVLHYGDLHIGAR